MHSKHSINPGLFLPHNSLRIGRFWLHTKNHEHRARCAICDAPTEDLQHILTSCPNLDRLRVRETARHVWPASLPAWQQPSYGQTLGTGLLNPPNAPDRERITLERARSGLLRIVISEATHLIWVLRCEWVTSERNHTTEEVKTRWLDKIT